MSKYATNNIAEQETEGHNIADYALYDYEDSGIECPKCHDATLRIIPEGTSPDDFTTYLKCPSCKYEERE